MNRMLADALVFINKLLAIVIVAGFGSVGAVLVKEHGDPVWIGFVVGCVVGVFAASLICGLVALLALIEEHLGKLAAEDSVIVRDGTTSFQEVRTSPKPRR